MADETIPIHPSTPAVSAALDAERVMAAVQHPTRRAILRALADSQPRQVAAIATAAGTQDTLAGKHLILMRKAGLLEAVPPPDGDGRKTYYRLPAHFVAHDAAGRTVLDFGVVVLRLP